MAGFYVLEGLDGAGTTTQAAALAAHLGPRTLRTNEPTDGPVGRIARRSLAGDPEAPPPEALPWLFAADRADHVHRRVLPALHAGRDVVSDRYLPSSLAYQSLTLPLEQVWQLNQHFPVPDRLFFVRIDVDTALGRIDTRGRSRDIYERRDRLEQVHAAYEQVLALLDSAGWPIEVVDGARSIDDVTTAILAALR